MVYFDMNFFREFNRGCRGNACPSESACTYDIAACGGDYCSSQSSRQCHKYYGVSCGIATTKTAAKPPSPLCDSKAYSSRQGAKKQFSIPHSEMWCRGLLLLFRVFIPRCESIKFTNRQKTLFIQKKSEKRKFFLILS